MRLLILFAYFSFIYVVTGKNNVKSLTESMGQEVIEINSPIKDLPAGLEEEPSAEVDDDKGSTTSLQPATRRDVKKVLTTVPTTIKTRKHMEKDDISQEDEEARIEKELAEIYKDTADYKSENSEEVKTQDKVTTAESNSTDPALRSGKDFAVDADDDKEIGRQGGNFKFQPNLNNKADIERFRTSVDELNCDKRVTQKLIVTEEDTSNSAESRFSDLFLMNIFVYGIKLMF